MWQAWCQRAALKKARIWNIGYVPIDRLQFWFVRLADDDQQDPVSGRVILEVLRTEGGDSDSQMAWSFRNQVRRGSLAIPPTPEQKAFLRDLRCPELSGQFIHLDGRTGKRKELPCVNKSLDQTYSALGTYVAEREIGVDGPIRELYLASPFDTSDESAYVTEVCWPVFRTAPTD